MHTPQLARITDRLAKLGVRGDVFGLDATPARRITLQLRLHLDPACAGLTDLAQRSGQRIAAVSWGLAGDLDGYDLCDTCTTRVQQLVDAAEQLCSAAEAANAATTTLARVAAARRTHHLLGAVADIDLTEQLNDLRCRLETHAAATLETAAVAAQEAARRRAAAVTDNSTHPEFERLNLSVIHTRELHAHWADLLAEHGDTTHATEQLTGQLTELTGDMPTALSALDDVTVAELDLPGDASVAALTRAAWQLQLTRALRAAASDWADAWRHAHQPGTWCVARSGGLHNAPAHFEARTRITLELLSPWPQAQAQISDPSETLHYLPTAVARAAQETLPPTHGHLWIDVDELGPPPANVDTLLGTASKLIADVGSARAWPAAVAVHTTPAHP